MAELVHFKFAMRNTRRLRSQLVRLARESPEKAKRALFDEAKKQMMMAFRKTPVDTDHVGGGALRDSADVGQPYQQGFDLMVPFGFGTTPETAKYALVQHQKHFKHTRGQRRYLADVVFKQRGRMVTRLAKALALR